MRPMLEPDPALHSAAGWDAGSIAQRAGSSSLLPPATITGCHLRPAADLYQRRGGPSSQVAATCCTQPPPPAQQHAVLVHHTDKTPNQHTLHIIIGPPPSPLPPPLQGVPGRRRRQRGHPRCRRLPLGTGRCCGVDPECDWAGARRCSHRVHRGWPPWQEGRPWCVRCWESVCGCVRCWRAYVGAWVCTSPQLGDHPPCPALLCSVSPAVALLVTANETAVSAEDGTFEAAGAFTQAELTEAYQNMPIEELLGHIGGFNFSLWGVLRRVCAHRLQLPSAPASAPARLPPPP